MASPEKATCPAPCVLLEQAKDTTRDSRNSRERPAAQQTRQNIRRRCTKFSSLYTSKAHLQPTQQTTYSTMAICDGVSESPRLACLGHLMCKTIRWTILTGCAVNDSLHQKKDGTDSSKAVAFHQRAQNANYIQNRWKWASSTWLQTLACKVAFALKGSSLNVKPVDL
eukprot:1155566-Pelagomonas_calceolata.AAC.9